MITQQIRVFISSTFNDLEEERVYLASNIFPVVKKYAAENGISFKEIDLRWGISEDAQVVKSCLKEVDNTRPFFIGILGARYGRILGLQDTENETGLFDEYVPFIKDGINKGYSITEIEMQYGVLSYEKNENSCFFVLDYKQEFESRQLDLIKKIQDSGNRLINCSSKELLGKKIHDYLFSLLNAQINHVDVVTKLTQYRTIQANILKDIVYNAIETEEVALIDKVANSTNRVCCVAGEGGVGKTTTVALWLDKYIQNEEQNSILYHFYRGGYVDEIFEHLTMELEERYNFNVDDYLYKNGKFINFSTEERFHYALSLLPHNEKLMVVIDGLERIIKDPDILLTSMSEKNGNLRIVFSVRPDNISNKYTYVRIPLLTPNKIVFYIKAYFAAYSRNFPGKLLNLVSNDRKFGKIQTLIAMLNELRTFASFDNLGRFVNKFVNTQDEIKLYSTIISNWESALPLLKKSNVLGLIAYAHQGIAEEDILAITKLSQYEWSSIYSVLLPHIQLMGNRMVFSNNDFKATVCDYYADIMNKIIADLATYYKTSDVPLERQFDELPYMLVRLSKSDELLEYLLKFDVFHYAYNNRIEDLKFYWSSLETIFYSHKHISEEISPCFFELSDYEKYTNVGRGSLSKIEYIDIMKEVVDFLYFTLMPLSEEKWNVRFLHFRMCQYLEEIIISISPDAIPFEKYVDIKVKIATAYADEGEFDVALSIYNSCYEKLKFEVEKRWNMYDMTIRLPALGVDIKEDETHYFICEMCKKSLVEYLTPYRNLLIERISVVESDIICKEYYEEAKFWNERLLTIEGNESDYSSRSILCENYADVLWRKKKFKEAIKFYNQSFELKFNYLESTNSNDPHCIYRLTETYRKILSCQASMGAKADYSNQHKYTYAIEKYGLDVLDNYSIFCSFMNYAASLYNKTLNSDDEKNRSKLIIAAEYYRKALKYLNKEYAMPEYIRTNFFLMICLERLEKEYDEQLNAILSIENEINKEDLTPEVIQILKLCHSIVS